VEQRGAQAEAFEQAGQAVGGHWYESV
jgi:hypothetical protein